MATAPPREWPSTASRWRSPRSEPMRRAVSASRMLPRSAICFDRVSDAKRSSSVKFSRSAPMPEPEKLNVTATKPAAASRRPSSGKKPQFLKPLNPWQTTTTGNGPRPVSGSNTSPRSGAPCVLGSSKPCTRPLPHPHTTAGRCRRGRRHPASYLTGGTEIVEDALAATGSARYAHPAPVLDEEVRQLRPLVAWNDLHQVELDLVRVGVACQGQESRQPADVRVDHDA